jgi:5-hydroxyisourate hydrolase-like protein (transthyretin family)
MPEAVKQVAIDTRAKYQAQLDAMGGEEPKVEKEEVVEKEVEKEVVAPKKERVKFERKPRTPKAPAPKKEEETPESKAEKSMEGKKLTVANCRELLAKLKTRREGAKKRVATRKKQGKPAELTTIEVLKKASDNLEKKVETEVNKDGKLQKTTITRSTKEVVDIVATIISGIPTKAERTEYINEVIADLKKLIDKVEPITEKMAKGGEIGQELMGGQPNQKKPSGAILLEVRKNGKEIVVTEDDGKTKELYVKSNGFSGYTLHYKGNEYEFANSLDSYAKGGKITRNKNKNDYNSMFEFFVENNYQPIGKRDLINMAYESSNGIDSAIPQSMAGDVDNTAYYVYDYQTDKMGELVDLREKLKFSNVKVDVTIVQDDELKYGDDLPSELQNATFHQALNYVFKNDDVEKFAIRPKK